MLLAAETPAELSGLLEIPKMITDLGWVGVAILVTAMFATGRWMSRKQHEEIIEAEKEITAVWKQNAEELKPVVQELVRSLEPVAQGNAAILKAIEALQASQILEQRIRDRLRDQGRE